MGSARRGARRGPGTAAPRIRRTLRRFLPPVLTAAVLAVGVCVAAAYLRDREATQVSLRAQGWESVTLVGSAESRASLESTKFPGLSHVVASGQGDMAFQLEWSGQGRGVRVWSEGVSALTLHAYSPEPSQECVLYTESLLTEGVSGRTRMSASCPPGSPRRPLDAVLLELPVEGEELAISGMVDGATISISSLESADYYYESGAPDPLVIYGTQAVVGPAESGDDLLHVSTSKILVPPGYCARMVWPFRLVGVESCSSVGSIEWPVLSVHPGRGQRAAGDNALALSPAPSAQNVVVTVSGGTTLSLDGRAHAITDTVDIVVHGAQRPESTAPRTMMVTGDWQTLYIIGGACQRHQLVGAHALMADPQGTLRAGAEQLDLDGSEMGYIRAAAGGTVAVDIDDCLSQTAPRIQITGWSDDVVLGGRHLLPTHFQQLPGPIQAALLTSVLGLFVLPLSLFRPEIKRYLLSLRGASRK